MLKDYLKMLYHTAKWKNRNKHNSTKPGNLFDIDSVIVGNYTYGDLTVLTFSKESRLEIGNFCSIAGGVVFVLNADHAVNRISTFPYKVMCLYTERTEAVSKGNIIVNDDVWIGQNAVILSGVTIGQGAVVAAGAIVTKDVPPYAIVAGVPAKVIKYRFSPELIAELMKINYSKLTEDMVRKHINELYTDLNIVKQLEWLPKR